MQNIVARHVKKEETSTSQKQEARDLVGFVCFVCKAAGSMLAPPSVCVTHSLGGRGRAKR